MIAFALSDITSPVDQVTTIPFLLEGNAVEYYHSLTNAMTGSSSCVCWVNASIAYPMSQCTCQAR